MLRLVVIHQLVLSLFIGSMPCCCASTTVQHNAKVKINSHRLTTRAPVKSCCDHASEPSDGQKPNPSAPHQCPCKESPTQATIFLQTSLGSIDSLGEATSGHAAFNPPSIFDCSICSHGLATCLPLRSVGLSTYELLFAHHNLRC